MHAILTVHGIDTGIFRTAVPTPAGQVPLSRRGDVPARQ